MYWSFIEIFCLLTLWVSDKSKKIYFRIYRGFEQIFKTSIAAQQITADVTSHIYLILLWLLANSFCSLWYGIQILHRKRTNAKLDLLNYNELNPKLHINIGLQAWHQILSFFNGFMEILKLFRNIFSCWSALLICFPVWWEERGRRNSDNFHVLQLSDSVINVIFLRSPGQYSWKEDLKVGVCYQCHIQHVIVQGFCNV